MIVVEEETEVVSVEANAEVHSEATTEAASEEETEAASVVVLLEVVANESLAYDSN